MQYRKNTGYALSLPERVVRSLTGLLAGAAREVGEVVLPARVRRSQLYSSVVGATLRFLLEQVAEIEASGQTDEAPLPADFLLRRFAGNVVELAGIATFSASPVWVLAALADLAGAGRDLMAEISTALQQAGLLESGPQFTSMNEVLDGLERTAARMAQTVNTPPLNVPAMREEWRKIRAEAVTIPPSALPDALQLRAHWNDLKQEAARQQRSVLELSSVMALAAMRRLPENARWLSRAVRVGGRHTGKRVAHVLLDHYRDTLSEIRDTGYLHYARQEFQPYFKGALRQFSLNRQSLTERLLSRVWQLRH